MESSRWDLFIDMIVNSFICKNNKITLYSRFIFKPKTGVGLPYKGASFYWAYCEMFDRPSCELDQYRFPIVEIVRWECSVLQECIPKVAAVSLIL